MGKTAVENAAKLLKGEKIQEDISLGVQLVTKETTGANAAK